MKYFLALLSIVVVSGCSSSGGGRQGFEWSQSPQFERDLAPTSIRYLDGLGKEAGLGEAYAAKWGGSAEWTAPEGYSGSLGAYSCKPCGHDGCAHAWAQYQGGYFCKFCFAGQPVDETIGHEWKHAVIDEEATDSKEVLAANNGHPEYVTIRGNRIKVREWGPGTTRWPAAVDWIRRSGRAVGKWINVVDDGWEEPNCVDGLMGVE